MFWRKKKAQAPLTDSIFASVLNGEKTIEEAQQLLNVKELEMAVNDKEHGTRDHANLVDLRQMWGRVILSILIVTIVGDFILIWLVGIGSWKFEGNGWFLNVVATEHLVQIFGLVLIVLNSLFPKEKS